MENELIEKYASDIMSSYNKKLEKIYMHHGYTSIFTHSLHVTKESIRLAQRFNVKVDMSSLIRGCLLHDYYLYDWHDREANKGGHLFKHASIALKNATRDYDLNKIEKNMIYTHMFPANIRIPRYKESIILCISDKICALRELTVTVAIFLDRLNKKTLY